MKTIVFGGLDGILTAHAVIAAAVGAKLNPSHVLALGISNVLADALSMVRRPRISPSRSLSLTALTLTCSRTVAPTSDPDLDPDQTKSPARESLVPSPIDGGLLKTTTKLPPTYIAHTRGWASTSLRDRTPST